ncbi:RES domain-containing protein [Methylobacter tundripaludum]|uniref:RES domain-containing protein n=1 Tax=Methylobacter tundripaludum TaxID=173365 RepID=A0A2S6HCI0_9GAMM|nr:RES family NAD+ phosphorylase [Methylobacter tundripaludum]PPK75187.1 RES domain-containing protein [Methylobacter tundripaludum]
MSFKYFGSYKDFSFSTRRGNRYIHSENVQSFLDALLETSKERERVLKKGFQLWRARIGNDSYHTKVYLDENDEEGEEVDTGEPSPYSQDKMKPLLDLATEGRANPKGIPYLYLATLKETAMHEVKPWVGLSISVGQFQINKDLRVIDFSKFHRANKPTRREIINLPKEERTKLEVWFDIDTAFSEPITPNDKTSDYVPTQIIAEFFKTKGFDGIVYRSSLAKGFNVVLFDLRAADLISCQLAEVESVKFNFKYTNPFSYLIERD